MADGLATGQEAGYVINGLAGEQRETNNLKNNRSVKGLRLRMHTL